MNEVENRPKLFLVDADATTRVVFRNWFRESIYNLKISTAYEVWESIENGEKCDMLLVNSFAPLQDKGGAWLLKKLKEGESSKKIIVVQLTGRDGHLDRKGEYAHIYHPYTKSVVFQKLATLFSKRTPHRDPGEQERKMSSAKRNHGMIKTPMQTINEKINGLLRSSLPEFVREELEEVKELLGNPNREFYEPSTEGLNPDNIARSLLRSHGMGRRNSEPSNTHHNGAAVRNLEHSSQLSSWTFDAFSLNGDEQLETCKAFFVHFGLLKTFHVPEQILDNFLRAVKKNYQQNPYHNFYHAVDVCQAAFSIMVEFKADQFLTSLDRFALLISALCHDMNHPGVNNSFLIRTRSELAVTYNDKSALENFHCASTFKLMSEMPNCNILCSLDEEQFSDLREIVVSAILATDLSFHFEYVTKIQQKAESGEKWGKGLKEDRNLLVCAILKAADLSNVSREWETSLKWGKKVNEEFFSQGDQEKLLGMTPEAFLDRDTGSISKTSTTFIDYIVLPLFKQIEQTLPLFQEVVHLLAESRKKFSCLSDKDEHATLKRRKIREASNDNLE